MSAEPVTSHAAAAAEIARLRGHVAALQTHNERMREALEAAFSLRVTNHVPWEAMARAALAATEEPGT